MDGWMDGQLRWSKLVVQSSMRGAENAGPENAERETDGANGEFISKYVLRSSQSM